MSPQAARIRLQLGSVALLAGWLTLSGAAPPAVAGAPGAPPTNTMPAGVPGKHTGKGTAATGSATDPKSATQAQGGARQSGAGVAPAAAGTNGTATPGTATTSATTAAATPSGTPTSGTVAPPAKPDPPPSNPSTQSAPTQPNPCTKDGQLEVVNLTFVHSAVGGTGSQGVAAASESSLAESLNKLFSSDDPAHPTACTLVQDLGYGRLLLHGTPAQNLLAKRAIAAIDIAWPQVQLNMWAIQVSGRDDQAVSREIKCIRDRILWTRDAITKLRNHLGALLSRSRSLRCEPTGDLATRVQSWREGPMSLNEMLIYLLLLGPEDQKWVIDGLRDFVDRKLGQLSSSDLRCAASSTPDRAGMERPRRGAAETSAAFSRLQDALAMPGSAGLCNAFQQFADTRVQVRALSSQAPAKECDTVATAASCSQLTEEPRLWADLARSRNRVDRALRNLMDAYSTDMQELLFDPLLESVRQTERTSRDDDGIALVGRSRLVVTSGMETDLAPEMASYVDTTRPKPFGTDLLSAAFPAKSSAASAAGLERIVGGIPQVQAALLAAAMLSDTEPRYVKVAPGIGIDVRPSVLPDESEARLTIDARFGVDTQELSSTPRSDLWAQPPPATIQSHHVTTDATVSVFDLFDLSSFSVDTVTPQAPFYVPILGRLPILGQAFQIPRRNKTVRHESILLVNTVVLPRSTLLTDPY